MGDMRRAILLLIATVVAYGPDTSGEAPGSGVQARRSGDQILSTRIAARTIQPGELIVLTVTSSRPLDETSVHGFGRKVPAFSVGAQTWQALIGIDVDVRPARYTLRVDARSNSRAYHDTIALQVVSRKFPTRRLTVDPSFVNPPPAATTRIADEARLLNKLWATSAPSRRWSGLFVRPVPGSSTSRFGSRSIFNGVPRAPHTGEDFAGAEGTPVIAPNAGRVALAQDLYFSGNTVVIDHGLGLFSLLAHLSAIDVKQGEQVTRGQRIGGLGATGRVTGPHLHWAVRINGARIDPSSLLAMKE
jgi:murein DD-endopeptidase MepM/ murein hydrolase activator NlpD